MARFSDRLENLKGKIVDTKIISLLAAILGLVGSVILAYSLNLVLFEVRTAVGALATSVESIANDGDRIVFEGLHTRLKNSNSIANSWVRAGLYCLFASTGLAALNIYYI